MIKFINKQNINRRMEKGYAIGTTGDALIDATKGIRADFGNTWKNIKYFDDLIFENEKKIISKLEEDAKNICPFLKNEGKFFRYCGKGSYNSKDKKPSPSNQVYQRRVDIIEMQLYCLSNFKNCSVYSGKMNKA